MMYARLAGRACPNADDLKALSSGLQCFEAGLCANIIMEEQYIDTTTTR